MPARHALKVVSTMASDDKEPVTVERFERRLAEVEGKLRLEIGALRVEMIDGFGKLRAEMADRNAEQLKWLLGFFVAQTGVQVALLTLFR
jgi:hypothetical protein